MKVIVIDDVSADEFKTVLAELKGSQLVIPLAPKPLAVPASATRTWGGKRVVSPSTNNARPYGYSSKEVQLLRGFHKDPANHYSNGRYLPGVLESLASSLGKKRNAVLMKINGLNMRKVKGLVHQTHKPTRFKKTPLEAPIEAIGAVRRRNQPWTPSLKEEFKKDYPIMPFLELESKYNLSRNGLYITAFDLKVRRSPPKKTDQMVGESSHAYMLRKKASVPWPTPPGKAAPAGPSVVTEELVQLEFPRLHGIDCQQHYVQRSFTSLAKHEFKELTYSGIGNFVLGIKSLQDWESFLTSAMTNFSLIAKVCGVPNRYRIASAGEDRVVRYG